MSSLLVNLAGSPFVNRRPVQRFALVAWVVGVLLAGVNGFLWLQYRHDSTALRARLADTRAAIDGKSRNVMAMNEELGGLRLAGQNAQVDFLNQRIAERTFPWSLLFERIAATLPDGVRILGLNPLFRDSERDRRSRDRDSAERVPREQELIDLKFQGVAKTDQELYRLIDAFFSSPVFAAPRLYQESTAQNEVSFSVDVQYRPWYQPEEESHQPAVAAAEELEEGGRGAADEEALELEGAPGAADEEALEEGEQGAPREPPRGDGDRGEGGEEVGG